MAKQSNHRNTFQGMQPFDLVHCGAALEHVEVFLSVSAILFQGVAAGSFN